MSKWVFDLKGYRFDRADHDHVLWRLGHATLLWGKLHAMTGDDITRLPAWVHATLNGIRTLVYSEREPRDPTMCRFDCSRRLLLGIAGTAPLTAWLRPLRALAQAKDSDKLRIGVIGSGHFGGTIGRLWVKSVHPVLFSSRHPEELKELVAELGPLAHNGTVAQAILFGEALLVAVPYGALPPLGKDYADALVGKIALDACTPCPPATAPSRKRWNATESALPRRNICRGRGWCAPSTRSRT
jgi:hypothetical protein